MPFMQLLGRDHKAQNAFCAYARLEYVLGLHMRSSHNHTIFVVVCWYKSNSHSRLSGAFACALTRVSVFEICQTLDRSGAPAIL